MSFVFFSNPCWPLFSNLAPLSNLVGTGSWRFWKVLGVPGRFGRSVFWRFRWGFGVLVVEYLSYLSHLSCPVLSYLPYLVLSRLFSSYLSHLSQPVLSCLISSCLVLSHPISSYLILFRPTSVCLSVYCLLSICLSVYLITCLSVFLPVYLSIYLPIFLSIDQSTNQSIYISMYLRSMYLFIYVLCIYLSI